MGEAVGGSLPFAVGLAVAPFPLIAMILILGAPRGRANAVAFAAASVLGQAAIAAAVVLLADGDAADASGAPRPWVSALRLALGLLLLAYAGKVAWTRLSAGGGKGAPAWTRAVETLGLARAAGLGLVLSAVNPKNLALVVAGGSAVAEAEPAAGQAAGAIAVMVLIGTLGVTGPLATTLALGARGDAALERVKDWMVANSDVIVAVVAVVFGASLIGDAIAGFSA